VTVAEGIVAVLETRGIAVPETSGIAVGIDNETVEDGDITAGNEEDRWSMVCSNRC
jgi:hypothetical protein